MSKGRARLEPMSLRRGGTHDGKARSIGTGTGPRWLHRCASGPPPPPPPWGGGPGGGGGAPRGPLIPSPPPGGGWGGGGHPPFLVGGGGAAGPRHNAFGDFAVTTRFLLSETRDVSQSFNLT